jgi:hypothetical protein
MLSAGDLVTYSHRADDANPPRGRLIQQLREQGGERIWLVAWETPDGREQRLKNPERSLVRLAPNP